MSQHKAISRNNGLDIVRSIAILPVVAIHFLTHAFPQTPPIFYIFGNYGVEIFFALSGFLIGGIVLREFQQRVTGRDVLHFWTRRWLRTVPLYYVFFVVTIFVSIQGFKVDQEWKTENFLYLIFMQNFAWPMIAAWFHESWSLAVEEWFYILFPILFVAAVGLKSTSRVLLVAVIAVVFSLAIRTYMYLPQSNWDEEVRKIVVLRFDAIAFGILAVCFVTIVPALARRIHVWLGIAGLIGVLYSIYMIFYGGDFYAKTLSFTITSASFAALVIYARFSAMAAACPPALTWLCRWISTRSYALYLCHGSIVKSFIAYQVFAGPKYVAILIYVVGCILVSEAAHRLIEKPFMNLRDRKPLFRRSGRVEVVNPI